jgi:7-carboxy-7-deazaguanine synthase
MSNSIEIVEIFGGEGQFAIQGEGKLAGVPAVFIRTFGCNLACKFGLVKSEYAAWESDCRGFATEFQRLEDLPVLSKGCDTYYSIFPEFRKFTKEYTVDELVKEVVSRCQDWGERVHLVITGGEPLLPDNQEFFTKFIGKLSCVSNIGHVTFETNATQDLVPMFEDSDFIPQIHFSMSPKLSCSGHDVTDTCCPDVVDEYIGFATGTSHGEVKGTAWFKFVINNESQLEEIEYYLNYCGVDRRVIPVYLMPEGGTRDQFLKNERKVYEICAKYGYCYSPRHQVTVMNNGIGI